MNNLFCTPEQGKRLKDLLPELTSKFLHFRTTKQGVWAKYPKPADLFFNESYHMEQSPALTLQELRDVFDTLSKKGNEYEMLNDLLWHSTAPELADWVIERLEESK
jgi:hypothetical protein